MAPAQSKSVRRPLKTDSQLQRNPGRQSSPQTRGSNDRNATGPFESTMQTRRSLQPVAKTVYCRGMHYVLIILAVVVCLAGHGCAPATDKLPPDSVLDPRGT
jgi:hypothetical protein